MMSLRLALLIMLLPCLALPLQAREVRMAGANGDGGACPEQLEADVEGVDATRPGKRASRDKPAVTRGAEPQAVRAPRWHSFLPGMFR